MESRRQAAEALSASYRDQHNERRKYEVRFGFSLLVITLLTVDRLLDSPKLLEIVFAIAGLAALTAVVMSYVGYLHHRNSFDVRNAEQAEKILQHIAMGETPPSIEFEQLDRRSQPAGAPWWENTSFRYQVAIAAVLVVTAASVLIAAHLEAMK